MKRGSHASPTREQGNPYCGPNKTAPILKSPNTIRNWRVKQDWLRPFDTLARVREADIVSIGEYLCRDLGR